MPVHQHSETRQVGRGERGAAQGAEQQRSPEAVRKQGEAGGSGRRQQRPAKVHPAGVEPVGQSQHRRRRHGISAEVDAGDPPRLRLAEPPLADKRRQQRRKREHAGHGQYLGDAHREDQAHVAPSGHRRMFERLSRASRDRLPQWRF